MLTGIGKPYIYQGFSHFFAADWDADNVLTRTQSADTDHSSINVDKYISINIFISIYKGIVYSTQYARDGQK